MAGLTLIPFYDGTLSIRSVYLKLNATYFLQFPLTHPIKNRPELDPWTMHSRYEICINSTF